MQPIDLVALASHILRPRRSLALILVGLGCSCGPGTLPPDAATDAPVPGDLGRDDARDSASQDAVLDGGGGVDGASTPDARDAASTADAAFDAVGDAMGDGVDVPRDATRADAAADATVDATADHPDTDAGPLRAVKVAAGGKHSCALMTSGLVRCWGDNESGELGNPAAGSGISPPVTVLGLSPSVTDVCAGYFHSCAIDSGTVKCWGHGYLGELGTGSTVDQPRATLVPGLTGVTSITCGTYTTCAVAGGAAYCWGNRGATYALGDGVTGGQANSPVPVVGVSAGTTAIELRGMYGASLVGTSVMAWGGYSGTGPVAIVTPRAVTGYTGTPVGVGSFAARFAVLTTTGAFEFDGTSAFAPVPGIGAAGTVISGGLAHACAIVGGAAYCWGDDSDGQLGNGATATGPQPVTPVVGLPSGVTSISAGWGHTCAVASGQVWCWGDNTWGQLSTSGTRSLVPTSPMAL